MDLVPYAIPIFALLIAVEIIAGVRRGHNTYRINDALNSIGLGIVSTTAKLVIYDYSAIIFGAVEHYSIVPQWPKNAWWTWLFTFFFYDFLYYWNHRINHERNIFWAAHIVHHQSEDFNLSTALRQSSSYFLLGWIFYIPSFLLGIPASVFFTIASINLLYQFWVHTEHIGKLGWYEQWFVTPSNHRVHHAQNTRYVDKNYGGVFIVWDRLFGTFEPESASDKPIYGITTALHSWNPLWANLQHYSALLGDAWHTRRWREKLKIWWMPTGWRPSDVTARFPHTKIDLRTFQRYDPTVSKTVQNYCLAQFIIIIAFSTYFLFGLSSHAYPERLAAFLAILISLISVGALLENKPRATAFETLRIAGLIISGGLYLFLNR